MSRQVVLGIVVGGLILAVIVSGGLRMSRGEELAPDEAVVKSIISWETIVSRIPKAAGYEVKEDISIRGKEGGDVTIPSDDPVLWSSMRWVSEGDMGVPGEYHSFWVSIYYYESEAALQKQIKVIPLAGYEVQEDENQVSTGFMEITYRSGPDCTGALLKAFAAKGRLWVTFTVSTYGGGDPFAERQELEELVSLVPERLIDAQGLSVNS